MHLSAQDSVQHDLLMCPEVGINVEILVSVCLGFAVCPSISELVRRLSVTFRSLSKLNRLCSAGKTEHYGCFFHLSESVQENRGINNTVQFVLSCGFSIRNSSKVFVVNESCVKMLKLTLACLQYEHTGPRAFIFSSREIGGTSCMLALISVVCSHTNRQPRKGCRELM